HRTAARRESTGARRGPRVRHSGRREGRRGAGAGASADPRAGSSLERTRPHGARRGRARAHSGSGLMTSRGRAVLVLGVFCWIVAIVFGSPALYPVAAGLVIAVPLAVAWVRITLRQPRVTRRWRQDSALWRNEDLLERDDVRIELILEREPGVPLPGIIAYERVWHLGDHEVDL